ncbi:hypothetical protein F2Q69_00036692 [Brassica cretica]|uniref:Uncharacterized protein n=1 Tax=Brassica cretica TaxID=69181 RepID=A0A8S9SKW3_BRACR|nr:hypothetical protein F2Q69_00036692 [Brassica cretica]
MSLCLSSSSNRRSPGICHSTFESLRVGRNSVIHRFIPAGRANHYMSSLKAGSIVKVYRFEIFKLADMVGQIRSVQGSDLSNETTRVVIRLLIDP